MITYSIIIPHHNCPELLKRLLDTIPQREDIEIIVVDDNSNPEKRPNVQRTDVRTIYLQAEESKGAGRARNIGLRHAIGKWLLFADSDDYYINNFIDKLDTLKESDYDIIFFDNDTNLKTKSNGFQNRLTQMLQGGKRERAHFKHSSNTPWNKMYSRQFVLDNNILFDEIPIQNDAYFVHKASSLTDNFHYINEKLYFYEINDSGITRKKRKKEDLELSVSTRIKVDKIKASSGAWDYINFSLMKHRNYKEQGFIFVLKQQLRRIRHGLLWYMIRKAL